MPDDEQRDDGMRLAWELRGDPDALHSLQLVPGLSSMVGGLAPVMPGPPVGSAEWWEAVEANAGATAAEGVIDKVDPRAGGRGRFRARSADGTNFEAPCHGGPDNYLEGSRVKLVRSFPPPGFVASGRLDADGGLILEAWVEDDE